MIASDDLSAFNGSYNKRTAVSAWSSLSLLLLCVYFFPLFPGIPAFASKIAYLPLLCVFLIFAVVKEFPKRIYGVGVFLFCSAMFFLQIRAEIVDPSQSSFLNSLTLIVSRYFGFIVYFSYFLYFSKSTCAWSFVRKSIPALTLITFVYVVLEFYFLDQFSFFIHFVYERDSHEILSDVANSFFFSSYFAAHFYLLLFSLTLSVSVFNSSFKWATLAFLCFFMIFLSQSKTGVLSAVVVFIVVAFVRFKVRYFLMLSILGVLLILMTFKLVDLDGFYVVDSATKLLEGRSNSFAVRIEQVVFAFNSVEKYSYILGAGVGRDLYLESWVALYLYRYGFLGIAVYLIFWFYLLWASWSAFRKVDKGDKFARAFSLGVFSWFSIIPLLSLSSSMWDAPKNGFFIYAFLAGVNALRVRHGSVGFCNGSLKYK